MNDNARVTLNRISRLLAYQKTEAYIIDCIAYLNEHNEKNKFTATTNATNCAHQTQRKEMI